MLGHGGSSAGSYLADPTSPIPSHCAVIMDIWCKSRLVQQILKYNVDVVRMTILFLLYL